jgi:uncharacterized protein
MVSEDAQGRKTVRERTFGNRLAQSRSDRFLSIRAIMSFTRPSAKPVQDGAAHRILAINRGEREDFLRVWIDAPETEMVLSLKATSSPQPPLDFTDDLRSAIHTAIIA